EELKEKIKKFEEKKTEVLSEKGDFALLLDGEMKKIIKNVLDEDSFAFRKGLLLKAGANLEAACRDGADMSLKKLHSNLEEQIIFEVKQAFNVWRAIEDEKLAKAFESACKRFITKIDETVDSLLKFSSKLFAVPFDAVKAEALWSTKSGFYYKFKDQPVGIEIAASSLTLLLPKFIGEKIIIKKMKEYLQRVIDMQSGRMGYDFEKRLDKSKLDFRWEMLQRIEATVEGITTAIEKGMNQRSEGEKKVEERKMALLEIAQKLDSMRNALVSIKEKI
ncbi:MAG TPA: dynamin, partial [Nitrospiraceae bacterium]|nr:dynamin [Nitrospiraceae bacterium]